MNSVDDAPTSANGPDPVKDPAVPGTPDGPRSPAERKAMTMRRLAEDIDVWAASADSRGVPCLVPLYFWWDGERVWLATRDTNPTGRNLRESGLVRLAFGTTRDVVLMEGTADCFTRDTLPVEAGDGFAAKGGWDPRRDHPSYVFFGVTPVTVQAWGTVAEMRDRDMMRDGVWLL